MYGRPAVHGWLKTPFRGPPRYFKIYNSSFHILCQVKLKLTLCQVSRTRVLILGDTNVKYIYCYSTRAVPGVPGLKGANAVPGRGTVTTVSLSPSMPLATEREPSKLKRRRAVYLYGALFALGNFATHVFSKTLVRFSASSASDKTLVLVDCDDHRSDLLMNFWLCWAKLRGIERAKQEIRVICLSHLCCDEARSYGLVTIGDEQGLFGHFHQLRLGYASLFERSYLAAIMVTRELIVLQLLSQGYNILRADADTCFTKDPLAIVQEEQLTIFASAQEVPSLELDTNSFWINNYSCQGETGLILSLNNGCMFLRATARVIDAYAWTVGFGLRLSAESEVAADGFAQKAFNEYANRTQICVNHPIGTEQRVWTGSTLVGNSLNENKFRVGIFSVCSPCDSMRYCHTGNAMVTHANCLAPNRTTDKAAFLRIEHSWILHDNWQSMWELARQKSASEEDALFYFTQRHIGV